MTHNYANNIFDPQGNYLFTMCSQCGSRDNDPSRPAVCPSAPQQTATATSTSMEEFQREFSFTFPNYSNSEDVNKFGHHLGSFLLRRTSRIETLANLILKEKKRRIFFFQGPAGSGKTVLLYLLGDCFKTKGHQVFYGDWQDLKKWNIDYKFLRQHFLLPAKECDSLPTILLIDEAHRGFESNFWKKTMEIENLNVIVIAAGVTSINGQSPLNAYKFSASDVFLQEEEVEELVDELEQLAKNRNVPNVTRDSIEEICRWVLDFTGGQTFPWLLIVSYMLTKDVYSQYRENFRDHLYSFEFFNSDTVDSIRGRCFQFDARVREAFRTIYLQTGNTSDSEAILAKFGIWDSNKEWITSDLLASHFLNEPHSTERMSSLQFTNPIQKIEAIIYKGLQLMDRNDFVETSSSANKTRVENALGFCWALRLKANWNSIFISPQTRAAKGKGKQFTTVDFVFDGEVNVAIELSKNGYAIAEKVKKISEGGQYAFWKGRAAILNFEFRDKNAVFRQKETDNELVYHFFFSENALYQGNNLIMSGVVLSIPTPPIPSLTNEQKVKRKWFQGLTSPSGGSILKPRRYSSSGLEEVPFAPESEQQRSKTHRRGEITSSGSLSRRLNLQHPEPNWRISEEKKFESGLAEDSLQEEKKEKGCVRRIPNWFKCVKDGGYNVLNCLEDGNCAVFAIHDQLKRSLENFVLSPQELRTIAYNNVELFFPTEEEAAEFHFVDSRIRFPEGATFEQKKRIYIEESGKPKVYLGEPSLIALSYHFQFALEIYTVEKKEGELKLVHNKYIGREFKDRAIRIIFSGWNHYDSLHPISCECGKCANFLSDWEYEGQEY